jgi:2-succinyl-5-enolpyruvyl-6-hydroxy-3-cyclohexene-1-carboxylate synthase
MGGDGTKAKADDDSTRNRNLMTIHAPNRNYLWTYTFVEALAQAGLHEVVIAPGSRSTPLTMAFAQHPHIRVYSHIDERGAAFMALGLALAKDAPVAVVCSSGTAAANFYPAIVEAHYAHVPLLILTADRPHELRDSGANQTVDQVKLYGDHVLWAVDVALPEAHPPASALRNLHSLAARAYALADGLPKGAVHLNFPFRKPLEPAAVDGEGWDVAWGEDWNHRGAEDTKGRENVGTRNGASAQDETPSVSQDVPTKNAHMMIGAPVRAMPRIERGVLMPTEAQVQQMAQMMREAKRIMIVCGPRTPGGDFPQAVEMLAVGGAVLFADGQSSVRYYSEQTNVIADYEFFLPAARQWAHPEVVIHFGAMPTSQPLLDYLAAIQPRYRIVVSEDGSWTDFEHKTDLFLVGDAAAVCVAMAKWWHKLETDRAWYELFASADSTVSVAFKRGGLELEWFDGIAVHDCLAMLQSANVFVASSLAVRHLDQYGFDQQNKWLRLYCNRGASGIDGTISSAIGVAAAEPDKPTVLIIGDLAFYHDMNALLAACRNGIKNLVIVLLNNNGGQIFRRLPVNKPEFEPYFTELFLTPHGMTFEHTAAQFGFAYARADDRDGFRTAFAAALASGAPTLVEVVTDAAEDARRRQALMDKVAEAIKAMQKQE